MGEVYRARDARLDRSVAIKILPTERATRDGIVRFEREARAASALNHPHILHVYDVGSSQLSADSEPVHYIAMELIDGETLRTKFDRQTEFKELLEPLIDVAEALEKAHAAGIVHRDLKPENIMVSRDGYAKVLDFGLAKLVERDFNADSPTEQFARTANGVVVGTAGYMSPEQVEGRQVDARSDIFSFGCILYEAVAGQRAFVGKSPVDTMHKILHDDPPMMTASPDLQRIIRKCLAKNPDERYQHIKEAAVDLRIVRRESDSGVRPIAARPSNRGWVYVAIAAVLLAIVIARLPRHEATVVPPRHEPFSSIDIERLTFTGDVASAGISRSGRYLAYTRGVASHRALWLKQLATGTDVQLISEPRDLGEVAFLPDESFIYFEEGDDVGRIPIVGGTPQKVLTAVASMVTFSPDSKRIGYVRGVQNNTLAVANPDGTNEQIVHSGEDHLSQPQWSPAGNAIVCSAFREKHYPNSLCSIDLRTRKLTVLRETVGRYQWMPDGTALIVSKRSSEPTLQLWYSPYPGGRDRRITADVSNYVLPSLTADGKVIAAVQLQASKSIWMMPANKQMTPTVAGRLDGLAMTWSRDGTLLYLSFDNAIHLKALKPTGEVVSLVDEPHMPQLVAITPAISPDGQRIAYTSQVDGSVWTIDRDGGNRRRVTGGNADTDPQWLDGATIAYTSYKRVGTANVMFANNGIWRIPIAGGSPTSIDPAGDEPRVSPDHRRIVFRRLQRLVVIEPDGRQRELTTKFDVSRATVRWAPDSTGLDYLGENGQLWRQPLNGAPPHQVTNLPVPFDTWAWTPDGKQLAVTRDTRNSDVVLIRDRPRS